MEGESRPDQEGFGEASLGEAQSSDPPPDPEMIEEEADESDEDSEAETSGGPDRGDREEGPTDS